MSGFFEWAERAHSAGGHSRVFQKVIGGKYRLAALERSLGRDSVVLSYAGFYTIFFDKQCPLGFSQHRHASVTPQTVVGAGNGPTLDDMRDLHNDLVGAIGEEAVVTAGFPPID